MVYVYTLWGIGEEGLLGCAFVIQSLERPGSPTEGKETQNEYARLQKVLARTKDAFGVY
jgi:hypothetical protein